MGVHETKNNRGVQWMRVDCVPALEARGL